MTPTVGLGPPLPFLCLEVPECLCFEMTGELLFVVSMKALQQICNAQ